MKKSLIALAVLAASGASMAQSSVTMYGLIDQGVSKANNSASFGANDGAGKNGMTTVQQGQASRLGFKGVEDLGGGMVATFDFQHRFTPDDGAAASTFWAAKSVVGLGGGFGKVELGRDYVPAFWVAIAGDPTGYNYVSQASSSYTWAGYVARDSTFRNGNTVQYFTPNMGGFTAQVAVSAGEGAAGKGRAMGFNAQYAAGPVYGGLAYDTYKANTGTDPKLTVLTVAYDLGMVRPSLTYAKANTSAATLNGTKDLTVAFAAPIGAAGRLYGSYSKATVDGAANDKKKIGLGYEHSLSKRTAVYTNIGSATIEGQARSTAYDLGVTHRF